MKDNQYLIFSNKGIEVYKGKSDFFNLLLWLNKNIEYIDYNVYSFDGDEHKLELIKFYFEQCFNLEANYEK